MYTIDIREFNAKSVHDLGPEFAGSNLSGDEIEFSNYYMKKNGKPFFGISGEFHFSRHEADGWDDEILKMKMAGVNVISTYVFWNHHESVEGVFNFSGRRNLRRFVNLCAKHGLYVILRIGPFNHGEVRNGGLPDWLYGKPYEVRHTNKGFMESTARLYNRIAREVSGMFFTEDGPVIAIQIDNEYMHSSAPWEMTTGTANEWVFGGDEGNSYMMALKDLAVKSGMNPVFYTCTGWGGAITPGSMMPLWGGYAYRPWLFYTPRDEHPSTKEYVYQDYHNNAIPVSHDFEPRYKPEDKPYACCEMGGGMMCSYYYRFQLPYKSVDAMANIKMASGCNFLGYYVFHGGTNPKSEDGGFLNEGQVSKISYDYQAAIGEFGQLRESYKRLKTLHYFANTFSSTLCEYKTVLPDGASDIDPKDLDTLRYAIRTDGESGYVFINNFQDHERSKDKSGLGLEIISGEEAITFENLSITAEENCILPFNMDLSGIRLVKATAQPITRLIIDGKPSYVFMRPEGMKSEFTFEEGVKVNGQTNSCISMSDSEEAVGFTVSLDADPVINIGDSIGPKEVDILCISRSLANDLYVLDDKGLVICDGSLLYDGNSIRLETERTDNILKTYPKDMLIDRVMAKPLRDEGLFGVYEVKCQTKDCEVSYIKVGPTRYQVDLSDLNMTGCKELIFSIDYEGDIGQAYIDGELVHDHFYNGAPWEIGLGHLYGHLDQPLTIYITPLKKGVNVNVESSMAGRLEEVDEQIGRLNGIRLRPVYEVEVL